MEEIRPPNGQSILLEEPIIWKDMPSEILEIIHIKTSPHFLNSLAIAALKPEFTLRLFSHFENVFADSCAKWISDLHGKKQENMVVEAFARILPLAPYLSTFLEKYLSNTTPSPLETTKIPKIHCLWEGNPTDVESTLRLQRILLAAFRLLNFDKETFSRMISGAKILGLIRHDQRTVRYLAVRIFVQMQFASDAKLEALIQEHVGKEEAIMGDYDGELVDYEFLSLFEENRLKEGHRLRLAAKETSRSNLQGLNIEQLSPYVVRYSNILLPRSNGPPNRPSNLISTITTAKNSEAFARSLLTSSPILLHGLAGSGKTSLVNDFARELGVDLNIITLHLNEQTDAKMLIGMYATGPTPGSFSWRPGVLTTAVREGRWVFIEDLDRAPNEVISVVLPLIERGELLIPSRGETIKAGRGFKLLASIRTSLNISGVENTPAVHMLGSRLWQRVPVQMPSQDELREIIDGTHPILHQFLPGIINVYDRLYILSQKPSFSSQSRTSLGRPISPRDLLKWCRRLDDVLGTAGSKTGQESISETTQYEMFMEAADCFAGSLQTEVARKAVIACIAEEMHIDPQQMEHFITSHIPRYEDAQTELTIGRVRLRKRNASRVTKPVKKSRPFANTTHAKRLLEQVSVAIKMFEPILLVGETGIGKTTVLQQLADSLGFKLTAVNLSQQSEVSDLLGGFKPVNIRNLAIPLKEEFDDLFAATRISATRNQRYIEQLAKCVAKSQWNKVSRLWREAPKMFVKILSDLGSKDVAARSASEQPTKRRKTESRLQSLLQLKPRWERFSKNLDQFDIQLSGGSKGFAFTFVEGNIIKAVRNGDWVLLDEINLASPDTLESIADLLHSGAGNTPSILLSETGEIERVRAHPDFRIFGAMNPATDVGKRDLPMGLRSRFTELYVESPDKNLDDLLAVINVYLKGTSRSDERAAHDVARLYLNTKRLADEKRLVDGANQVPHFSLRTLTRVLSYVTEIAPSYGLRRALYEGFAMGFLTLLNSESEKMLMPLINHHLLDSHGNPQSLLAQTPKHPDDGKQYVRFMNKKRDRQYWMLQGQEPPQEQQHYIITPFVERNMLNLVRATSTRRFPVLVQGPTSSGKTSMIEYLAKFSGNKFVRINNHEHTDLQEYLGTYISGSDGQLYFQEGLLVQALRQGHWIVLDELNLAPTDVLEALNRLLDDNRELLIPETQEIVHPHDNFMLFATQNPPGLYGGRKTLSRAFRNRFLELHFDDIPEDELDFILEKRSQKVAPSDCRRIVAVYKELSRLRQSNRLFEQKDSFATLRDLFRWALRDADNREQLAQNGYMLLAERVRNPEERDAVKDVIERVMKVKIDPDSLYDDMLFPEIKAYNSTPNNQGVVWTRAMRRLFILVAHALRNNEPVLLVGETGCGKTTVCQMLAEAFKKELHIVNAHQNTETGDLIGAQRPVRNRAAIVHQLRQDIVSALKGLGRDASDAQDEDIELRSLSPEDISLIPVELRQRIDEYQIKAKALFEWSDGGLVQAMKEAHFFLLDEISLADDSVLERLNSVLEPQRTILLAEKGVQDSFIEAAEGFQFFATMNPGGDYGKRELSPALRNRFTEIWVPSLSEHNDVLQIVEAKLDTRLRPFARPIVHFAEWFGQTYRSSASTSISVRDILAWVKFVNGCTSSDPYFAVLHGAAMVYIDTLGANPAALLAVNSDNIYEERAKCLEKLSSLLDQDVQAIYFQAINLVRDKQHLKMGEFSIVKQAGPVSDPGFAFEAPTTKLNAMRVIRALQVQKPILIEGSPGVGKTTLIAALARACNRPLTRINLSEQTDLMDLFGSDVPVEGADAGHFAWRDAPFLQAMQKGEWVLLDEMNLASQSVLEGLNACLDHRGEVYISELDQTFKRHPNFSVFAAQNPHHQGGGRKGLPSSFVNRFTVVYADVFRTEDLELICKHNFPATPDELIISIINFVSRLEQDIVHKHRFGSQGGPWEFNLRDILRWLQLLSSSAPLLTASRPTDFLNLIFRQRFREPKDRLEIDKIFSQVFGSNVPFRHFFHNMSPVAYQVGLAYMPRDSLIQKLPFPNIDTVNRLAELESVMICIQQNLPCILVGPSGSGKSAILQHIAATRGKPLVVFPLNADIDTMDLVGGFEQIDPNRAASAFLDRLGNFLNDLILRNLPYEGLAVVANIIELVKYGDRASDSFFLQLESHLRALAYNDLADTCRLIFRDRTAPLESARFEWVDGILVKALEEGKWLVLDNANLCSASVLDRLNSLLEPNGFLSINEHCGPDGEPKIVKPHTDFRIFLTMDARFGELSRAMRNRAVEIYLEPLSVDKVADAGNYLAITKPESSIQRYCGLSRALEVESTSQEQAQIFDSVALDNLAWSDLALLSRYAQMLQQKLVRQPTISTQFIELCQDYLQIYQSEDNLKFRQAMGESLDALARKTGLPFGFKDAQIIHPLQNSPLVPLLQEFSDPAQVYWLAALFELKLEISQCLKALQSQKVRAEHLKPSKMNRLQRSLINIPAVAKDSTLRVWGFLADTLRDLSAFLQENVKADESWIHQKKELKSLLRYWWDTYKLATEKSFEEASFQAHLSIGQDLISDLYRDSPGENQTQVVQAFHQNLQNGFDVGFKLTTGLSMEILWKQLRPTVISKFQVMENLAQMEQLAVRFDALRWTVSISVAELGYIMSSLVKAYHLLTANVDGQDLIQALGVELDRLETSIGTEDAATMPFLRIQFEALRQFKTLDVLRSGKFMQELIDVDMTILANHPTTAEMRLSSSSKSSRSLQSIDYLWGRDEVLQPISDTFAAGLLHRLNAIGKVDLKSLKLLEAELPIMGEKLALSSGNLVRNQLLGLNDTLQRLILDVVAAHGDTGREYLDWVDGQNRVSPRALSYSPSGIPTHLQTILTDYFNPAIIAISEAQKDSTMRMRYSATAWVAFAMGCILLFVPDKSFDPDKRQRLEHQRHDEVRLKLQNKLAALTRFENLFSGQDSNLRCALVQEEIDELGEPAEIFQAIYRPETSELNQLQGEFKNLLKTIVQSNPSQKLEEYFDSSDEGGLQEIKLMQNNVLQIIRRLSERFRAYNDLTAPVISMLRCLQIGFSMATMVSVKLSAKSTTSLALSKMTPFVGGCSLSVDKDLISGQPMEYLTLVATTAVIEGISSFTPENRQSLLKAFHLCYDQWTKKLESDRLDAESKNGLYRFRGSAEDEDEEDQDQFNELFPTYDEDSSEAPNANLNNHSARETAIGLSRVHADVFLGATSPTESIISLIRKISTHIGALHEGNPVSDQTLSLLPGTFLLLNDQIESLNTASIVSESYNFYTDANLPEARKLVSLIHQIQARFVELQAVDEISHMQPLKDVLYTCSDLLRFRHTEPLAKIIIKVEKVHGFMHEWQFGGWASRLNSALTLYDNITSTIVNWRRLELSTWAKLFDMESKKCDDDARSWWFVAYQVIIAAPLSMSGSVEELKDYARKLLQDLQAYFSTAIMGQFVQRLQLLKQLQKHLDLLMLEYSPMSVIHGALTNFIAMYSRYENSVIEHLKKSRVSLEKAMRDVLLLASWKDTNIVALRDSAKRSHHKLFKIVRKFRSLLGQPMEAILKQGLPDQNVQYSEDIDYRGPSQYPTVDLSAVAICTNSVPRWSEKAKRFVNISKTVNMMVGASQIPDNAVDGSKYLNSFISDIIASTAELQKATPSVLTEDNKDTVKHLKSRKRKLFADTLKDLRQMGIKYNLGVDALAKQDSLAIILANSKPLLLTGGIEIQGLEYYFYKTVDLSPRAREAARQHSEDLSLAEVARSTGFLEGFLQVVLTQRNILSNAVRDMMELEQVVKMAGSLWAPEKHNIKVMTSISSHDKLLRWLPNILSVSLDLVKIHAQLSKVSSEDIQYSISSWEDIFTDFMKRWDDISELPDHIISTERQTIEKSISDSAQQLRIELEDMSEKRQDLSFIFRQILPWTEITSSQVPEQLTQSTVTNLDQELSTVCDAILVAIEKHKKSITDLPTSTEDLSWFAKNDNSLASSIKSLHCENIRQQIKQAFNILRSLDLEDAATSKAASAIFAVALPILQQYTNILQKAITRYGELHRASCKTSYILSKTFIQIATQGFCTPSEKSDAQDGQTEKLEGGTGLGDGEGAEDISNDIQDDEDLDDLAQEPNTGEKGEIEDEQDAVDMADGEMEGEMGETEEKEDEDGESGEENEMDEETGDVDDLDPTAVDEKMWDGDREKADKDQEGDDSKGKPSKDEQVAAQDNNQNAAERDEGEEEEEIEGAEQGEEVTQDQVEKHDLHAQEGETLELPDDMDLDGQDESASEASEASEDEMNDLSDIEDTKEGDEVANDGKSESGAENADAQEDQDMGSEIDVVDLDEEPEVPGDQMEEAGEKAESESEEQQPEDQEGLLRDQNDDANTDANNTVPSDVQGVGEDQDENSADKNVESSSKAQRDDGGKGGDTSEKNDAAAEDGENGKQAKDEAPQDFQNDTLDSTAAQPFKKLGDALESWHRQQKQIREPAQPKDQAQDQDVDMSAESSEYQHLQDEDARADTQALGTATEEQARGIDESMALENESKEIPESFPPDKDEKDDIDNVDTMDIEPIVTEEQEPSNGYEGRAGAIIQRQEHHDQETDDPFAQAKDNFEEDVEEVDSQLDRTHLDESIDRQLQSMATSREQWQHYETLTLPLSLNLTSQLRLILAPTLATKMRGDFRTGKRLNIKRIIPYIASSYKRDKIWMRRSIPSKRAYQIMLAVDDSKSMGESGSGALALETLVMVSKALGMLEVGEMCVLGFGERVKIAHDFTTPFSSDAGPKILQNFTFQQERTDVTKLVRSSIEFFRAARLTATHSVSDLWQIELIISDGVCDSSEHDGIRILLREAVEERIMMVFVIVDDVRKKRKGESVLDLKEARFVRDESTGKSEVKIERYLDRFPFMYYVVVGDVAELPGVLAGLLRQWFGEVVDAEGR
ncbi:hypothetical protein B7494_g4151 [Chlorociboria aeruginascens]|nr:hypothetical protein B7494_g4151 [Chlorociboria aeruginascens]